MGQQPMCLGSPLGAEVLGLNRVGLVCIFLDTGAILDPVVAFAAFDTQHSARVAQFCACAVPMILQAAAQDEAVGACVKECQLEFFWM